MQAPDGATRTGSPRFVDPLWHGIPTAIARRFHQICTARTAEVVSEFGLTPLQYGVMVHLTRIPGDGIEQNVLADRINVDRNTASLLVEQLVKMDIVASGSSSDGTTPEAAIALGNGDGTFQTPTVLKLSTFGYADGIALADFTGDGKLDLFAQGIFPGNGDGTFQTIANTNGTVDAPQLLLLSVLGAAVGTDLDGDGHPDLVVGNTVLYAPSPANATSAAWPASGSRSAITEQAPSSKAPATIAANT